MQQSGGLLLAASWMAATPLFSFPRGMKMQFESLSAPKNIQRNTD
jgi:hypothetical protein